MAEEVKFVDVLSSLVALATTPEDQKWLHDHFNFSPERLCSEAPERLCSEAARDGRLEILKILHENGCPWDRWTCISAAETGHLECLRYAHEHNCPWDNETCRAAAETGHLECLKYAHENNCPWSWAVCTLAAMNGHLECLKYAHENGCPWDEDTCRCAAWKEHLKCLDYALTNGCPWVHLNDPVSLAADPQWNLVVFIGHLLTKIKELEFSAAALLHETKQSRAVKAAYNAL